MIDRQKLYQNETGNLQYIQDFEEAFKNLTNQYNEAKENMKFLATLERQFKNLALEGTDIEDLNIIEVIELIETYVYLLFSIGNYPTFVQWTQAYLGYL